jgi:N-ethylmaleimide reductase
MTAPPNRTYVGDSPRDVFFEPYRIADGLLLRNRIVLAPCTRNRALDDLSPTPGAVAHYAQRADAGLLITEATLISPESQGYYMTPGIFLDSHVKAWAAVTEAVHRADGLIFLQLWHTGRMAHSHWTGEQPQAPSAILDPNVRRQAGGVILHHEVPREMNERDIAKAIGQFGSAASRAKAAGFDGVEIHGANGYLPEQFMRAHTNRRSDAWGATSSNRIRFMVEVVDSCCEAFGAQRVGLRVSPAAYFSEMQWTQGDNETYVALLNELNRRGLAYLHTGIVDDDVYDYLGCTSSEFLRRYWTGTLMGNGGFTPDAAALHLASGAFDLIAFGKLFLANPDLVQKIALQKPLHPYSRELLDHFR